MHYSNPQKEFLHNYLSAHDVIALALHTYCDYFKFLVVPCNATGVGLEEAIVWGDSALHHGQRLVPPRWNKASSNTRPIVGLLDGVVLGA